MLFLRRHKEIPSKESSLLHKMTGKHPQKGTSKQTDMDSPQKNQQICASRDRNNTLRDMYAYAQSACIGGEGDEAHIMQNTTQTQAHAYTSEDLRKELEQDLREMTQILSEILSITPKKFKDVPARVPLETSENVIKRSGNVFKRAENVVKREALRRLHDEQQINTLYTSDKFMLRRVDATATSTVHTTTRNLVGATGVRATGNLVDATGTGNVVDTTGVRATGNLVDATATSTVDAVTMLADDVLGDLELFACLAERFVSED
jgi:hypothetical protein